MSLEHSRCADACYCLHHSSGTKRATKTAAGHDHKLGALRLNDEFKDVATPLVGSPVDFEQDRFALGGSTLWPRWFNNYGNAHFHWPASLADSIDEMREMGAHSAMAHPDTIKMTSFYFHVHAEGGQCAAAKRIQMHFRTLPRLTNSLSITASSKIAQLRQEQHLL